MFFSLANNTFQLGKTFSEQFVSQLELLFFA